MEGPFAEQQLDGVLKSEFSIDVRVAEVSGKPVRLLQRDNTLQIDRIGELRGEADVHVFSADYDVYALPKHQ